MNWIPGMLIKQGFINVVNRKNEVVGLMLRRVRVEVVRDGKPWVIVQSRIKSNGPEYEIQGVDNAIPDLDDPATKGCLLEMVRNAWGDNLAHVAPVVHMDEMPQWPWEVRGPLCGNTAGGQSEAKALIAALESAS